MKYPLLAIIFMGMGIRCTYGQNKYDPLLKEGKHWNYRIHNHNTGLDIFYSLEVAGDSLFKGVPCKRILYVQGSDSRLYSLMYENDRCLYNWNGDSWDKLYDFNLEVGDEISHQGTEYYVCAIDSIDISGYKRLRLHFGLKDNEFHMGTMTWIEGIGSGNGLLLPLAYNSDTSQALLSCYEGVEKIFEGGYTRSHIWEYTYFKDFQTIDNTIFGESMSQRFRKVEEYESGPLVIGNHSYLAVKAIGRSDQPAGYPLGIREEGGRVYVNHEAYLKHLAEEQKNGEHGFPVGDPDYIPYYTTGDGEMILYDYNMEVGDAYCHVEGHEDITVVRKDSVRLKDLDIRRRLTLSNGLVLIEGLGCTNSPGMMFAYLNPSKNYQSYFCFLASYNCFYGSVGSIYQPKWIISPNPIETIQNKISILPNSICDLQGRRLQKAPLRGIYIQNGKKIIK